MAAAPSQRTPTPDVCSGRSFSCITLYHTVSHCIALSGQTHAQTPQVSVACATPVPRGRATRTCHMHTLYPARCVSSSYTIRHL
eukprot:349996-Prymnesium_polylepis.1